MPIASNRCTDGLGTRFLEIECNPWFGGSYINCKTSAFGTELCGLAQNLRNIQSHNQRGARHKPRRLRHFLQASGHNRVGIEIWEKFNDYGRLSGLDVTRETFETLNRELRVLGFHGSKASYELRKICIDHVYQKYGAEMAVSISGDDIRTITKYYADPAQPNLGAVRIVDLL